MSADFSWTKARVGRLEFYGDVHLGLRLAGLSDDEYFWEPAPGNYRGCPTGSPTPPLTCSARSTSAS
ncbi:MAG TPA: hypothetical protein VE476_06730 [Propionibacteriaceae bacterium]|nr:hypothetical protein [Propionibacteriaceae bacterium]